MTLRNDEKWHMSVPEQRKSVPGRDSGSKKGQGLFFEALGEQHQQEFPSVPTFSSFLQLGTVGEAPDEFSFLWIVDCDWLQSETKPFSIFQSLIMSRNVQNSDANRWWKYANDVGKTPV